MICVQHCAPSLHFSPAGRSGIFSCFPSDMDFPCLTRPAITSRDYLSTPRNQSITWTHGAQFCNPLPSTPYHQCTTATTPWSAGGHLTPIIPPVIPPAPVISLQYDMEPGTFPAEPFGSQVPVRIHPHLIYNPINPLVPTLQWDIIHPAEIARLYTGHEVLIPCHLEQEAFAPTSVSMAMIYSDHPVLAFWMEIWGPIIVEKSSMITIRDILDAIYNYFRRPLTKREIRRIKSVQGNSVTLDCAWKIRAQDSYELYRVGLNSGYKRADVIGGHRRFQGLRPVILPDNTWTLNLGLLPGPVPRIF